jgi:hypothetical protein
MFIHKDHRKHKRFQAPKDVFVGVGPHDIQVGRLRDIGMGGLGFRHIGNGDPLKEAHYVDIFMLEGDFYLSRVPVKAVSDIEVLSKAPSAARTMKRCCLKFKRLTAEQQAKLKEFIDKYALGES